MFNFHLPSLFVSTGIREKLQESGLFYPGGQEKSSEPDVKQKEELVTSVVRKGTRLPGSSSPEDSPHGGKRKISEKLSAFTSDPLALHEIMLFISNSLRENVGVSPENRATMFESDGIDEIDEKDLEAIPKELIRDSGDDLRQTQ